jgi:hypothetical protein
MMTKALAIVLAGVAIAPFARAQEGAAAEKEKWIALFDGKSLEGWTPKIVGQPLGQDADHIFSAGEGGVIRVAYPAGKDFGNKFGHLFYKTPYGHYRLRIEYRFVGEQAQGGPGWAFRNSGVMIHGQDPKTMRVDQDFPVSIEVQFLGGTDTGERPTANLCTPGTNVVMDGKLHTTHCTNSKSKTIRGDEWVTVEVEAHGDGVIKHFVDGVEVIAYEEPQLDPSDADAKALLDARGGEKRLTGGYLSLQAESHPIEFRKVEILPLPAGETP